MENEGRATKDGDAAAKRTASAEAIEVRREAPLRNRDALGAMRRVLARQADAARVRDQGESPNIEGPLQGQRQGGRHKHSCLHPLGSLLRRVLT